MGCHPATVITAIAASNEDSAWLAIEADLIMQQAESILQNMAVSAFKVGTLMSAEQVRPVAELLADYGAVPVVLDPAIERGRSEEWEDDEVLEAMRELLLPQSTVVTLSLAQARRLVASADEGESAETYSSAQCARQLIDWGVEYVLVFDIDAAGGMQHNLLFDESGLVRRDVVPRLADPAGSRFRGAGDTLSAALAGLLAQGIDMPEAVQEASQYTTAALMHAFPAGFGIAIPDRLFWAGDDDDEASSDAN
jgi:hydroxymethylpyrimidine/phosphomethylpyrimidine kinase